MMHYLIGLFLGTACGTWEQGEPQPPPNHAIFEVGFALGEAAESAGVDVDLANEACDRAVRVFEADVEPALRQRHNPRVVAAVELEFSQFRQTLTDNPATATDAAATLEQTIRTLFGESDGG